MGDGSGGEIIKTIQWTFDALCKLLDIDYKTRKDRFEKVFAPLFSDLETIHSDYLQMFDRIRKILPNHNSDNLTAKIPIFDFETYEVTGSVQDKIGSSQYLENMLAAKQLITADRDKKNALRISARSESTKIIKRGQNQLEKRFCWSVLSYFLHHTSITTQDRQDDFISKIENQGFHDVLDSPSSLMRASMFDEKDPQKVLRNLISIETTLKEKELLLRKSFDDLKLNVFG